MKPFACNLTSYSPGKLKAAPSKSNLKRRNWELKLDEQTTIPANRLFVGFTDSTHLLICTNKKCATQQQVPRKTTGRPPNPCSAPESNAVIIDTKTVGFAMPPDGILKLHHMKIGGRSVSYSLYLSVVSSI
jgi:hypothetical protein